MFDLYFIQQIINTEFLNMEFSFKSKVLHFCAYFFQLALSFIIKMALVSSEPKRQIKAIGSMHTEASLELYFFHDERWIE